MGRTAPVRVDEALYSSAAIVGPLASRSIAEQITHWARVGREVESSGSISHREVLAVLAGARSYDDLNVREQAVVRAEWEQRLEERLEGLDLAEQFRAEGRSWAELDDDDNVITHGA